VGSVGGAGGGVMMVEKAYALKFESAGIVPEYSLMRYLFCSAGERAELAASQHLARYVLHGKRPVIPSGLVLGRVGGFRF
jgi:hypothetical protein